MQLKSCHQGEQLGRSVESMDDLWQFWISTGKMATNSWLKLEDWLKMPAFLGAEVEPGGELDLAGLEIPADLEVGARRARPKK